PDSVIKAQVQALTGLAQVLTGGAALVLLAWWMRNWRRNRRARLAVAAVNHPTRAQAVSGSTPAILPTDNTGHAGAGITGSSAIVTATPSTTATTTITAPTVIVPGRAARAGRAGDDSDDDGTAVVGTTDSSPSTRSAIPPDAEGGSATVSDS
ncbi:MAG TPA: hypothetical protein PLV68_09670, partial [Ilumatobacteraceae bacterium]|nr:hypothetical protein [Ilumatobacteraceae bacterium]